jgi:hypothetical protein
MVKLLFRMSTGKVSLGLWRPVEKRQAVASPAFTSAFRFLGLGCFAFCFCFCFRLISLTSLDLPALDLEVHVDHRVHLLCFQRL